MGYTNLFLKALLYPYTCHGFDIAAMPVYCLQITNNKPIEVKYG